MSFTNPNAFWLFFLVLIPVLIHLFQFRRYKTLKFSNLYFLNAVHEEEKKSRKLKHILILISRILLIIFLTFSLAKPFWKNEATNSELNLILVDDTPSNLSFTEGKSNSIFDENIGYVNRLYERYPQSLKAININGELISAYSNSNILNSKSSIDIKSALSEYKDAKKLLILSDYQENLISENINYFKDTTKAFIFMPPYLEKPTNAFIDSVWIDQNAEETASLNIRISLFGNGLDVNLSLLNNDQLEGTQQISLEDNASSVINFPLKRFAETKVREYEIKLEGDEIEFDNQFYFSVINQEKLNVLSLSATEPNTLITTLFENEDLFNLEKESLINFSYQNLENYDLVLLEVGNQLSSFASSALKSYAAEGKNLVIIPNSNFDQFNFLEELGFSNISLIKDSNENSIRLSVPDIQNPFYTNIFSSLDGNISMPESRLFMRWTSGRNLLSFVNTYPFLSVVGIQDNIYAFSSPLKEDFTNFTRHGIFLPVFYKIAFSGNNENQVQYSYLNDDLIQLNTSNLSSSDIFKLKQLNQELVPDQRVSTNQLQLILPTDDINNGFYEIINTKTEEVLGPLALNYPKAESENSYYTTSKLKELFQGQSNVEIIESYDFSSIDEYIAETKEGFPLWKYFLVLALLSLLAEVLIIRFLK
ncbi:BatA domain-containing protein [Marivirga arenosa]|uniref:BatA domain-containing protein n=1 Tax=Marivirga arenosa TaxID=3059076 RepID=A0AA52EZJ4_9BACT|nr:BatA domain-containing protein [Marivirga sp. BKB1-2]WNB18397.1 BatA domain-containing protein [Marivirga sp. BKB1-2]